MADVLPFPLTARRSFIARQAAAALDMKVESGERHIVRTIQQQADVLTRKGVDPVRVQRETTALEAAIRAAMWRQTFSSGGAA